MGTPFAGVMYALSAQCGSCRKAVPINGACESVLCDGCQTPLEAGPELFRMIRASASEALAFGEGEGRNGKIFGGSHQLDYTYGRLAPRCEPDCKTPLPPDEVFALVSSGGGTLACAACQKEVTVRPAPPWFRDALHPAVLGLVGESLAAEARAEKADPAAVRFHCYHCGASMPLDGESRAVSCAYCHTDLVVPDDIWVRINPVRTVDRWFVLMDMRGAVGVLPADCDEFCDFTVDPAGRMVVAWLADDDGDAGHPCRVALADGLGRLIWLQDGVTFSERTDLVVCRSDASVAIIDRERNFVRLLDAGDGAPIRTLQGRGDADTFLEVKGHDGLAIDWDGSFLVQDGTELRRYAPTGERIAAWPGGKIREPKGPEEWSRLTDAPERLPRYATVCVGWDGYVYAVDRHLTHVGKWSRDGRIVGVMETGYRADRVHAVDVARDGTMVVLYAHQEKFDDRNMPHLARIDAGGRLSEWRGPATFAPGGDPEAEVLLGSYVDRMELMPDGRVYLGRDFDCLRVLDANGQQVWCSSATVENDRYLRERFAKARRPKKVVEDRE